jgi:hypothetical protein
MHDICSHVTGPARSLIQERTAWTLDAILGFAYSSTSLSSFWTMQGVFGHKTRLQTMVLRSMQKAHFRKRGVEEWNDVDL